MKPTLVILAAGLGSRYGSLKQLETIREGNAILDYSVYDALRAGFGKVVFVIQRSMEQDFKMHLMKRFEKYIQIDYVFQELNNLPEGYSLPLNRKKPWGTAHAILTAEPSVKEPFTVINADDFYGKEAFDEMSIFLTSNIEKNDYGMIGYKLKNTLSEHGSVSRGVCDTNEKHYLKSVTELTKISRQEGRIVAIGNPKKIKLLENSIVSMNMWGFTPHIFTRIKEGFVTFLDQYINDPEAEYYIPALVDRLIQSGEARVKVLHCDASWFGITYREDRDNARNAIIKKIENGEYPEVLWK